MASDLSWLAEVNQLWPEAKFELSLMGRRGVENTFILITPLSRHFVCCGTKPEIETYLEGVLFTLEMSK